MIILFSHLYTCHISVKVEVRPRAGKAYFDHKMFPTIFSISVTDNVIVTPMNGKSSIAKSLNVRKLKLHHNALNLRLHSKIDTLHKWTWYNKVFI